MKIFLSALEASPEFYKINANIKSYNYSLMSFYYIRNKPTIATIIRDKAKEILIDSGAHSFQKGKAVNWVEYTKQYAKFIKEFDRPNVIGYFEMDVDNIIGYDKVLELRKILENVSNKIIPVWHKNRGIEEFKKMCKEYSGKIIAITGFKNEDIKDDQYIMFLKYARKYSCKVHCLGMTRKKVLDKVPFDYVDSSSWKQKSIFGKIDNKKVSKDFSKKHRSEVMLINYKRAMEMQEYYYNRWRKICKN